MKKIVSLYFLFIFGICKSQTIAPQVINSAGGHFPLGNTGITVSDNVGEPFIQTLGNSNFLITQGFLQPDLVAKIGPTSTVVLSHISCKDKKDGFISVSVSNLLPTYTVSYNWLPTSICPASNCSFVDSLSAGNYTVQVVVAMTTSTGVKNDSLPKHFVTINDNFEPCKIKIYNAVTPNGDNVNDGFTIENISDFPNNTVTIYNRWGQKLQEIKNYDNTTNYWPTKDEATRLISSTYFYIINLGDNSSPIKGWVEILKD